MQEYWITNISKKVIFIEDLGGILLLPGKSYNLLKKRNNLSLEDINKSMKNGDLFKKSKFIKIGKINFDKIFPKMQQAEASPSTVGIAYEEQNDLNLIGISLDEQNFSDTKFVEDIVNAEDDGDSKTKIFKR